MEKDFNFCHSFFSNEEENNESQKIEKNLGLTHSHENVFGTLNPCYEENNKECTKAFQNNFNPQKETNYTTENGNTEIKLVQKKGENLPEPNISEKEKENEIMKKNDEIEKENNINGKNAKQTNICENKMDEIEKKNKKDINKRFKKLSKKRKRNETNKNKKETKKNKSENNKIKFITTKFKYRRDYYIIDFKTNFLQYLLHKRGNEEIKILTKKKLHMPNCNLYQEEPGEKENKKFLKQSFREVFSDYGEDILKLYPEITIEDLNSSLQLKNAELINELLGKINEDIEEHKKLKSLFESNMETLIYDYYESPSFEKFKKLSEILFYDEHFKKEKYRNISLLEKGGFINYVNWLTAQQK